MAAYRRLLRTALHCCFIGGTSVHTGELKMLPQ